MRKIFPILDSAPRNNNYLCNIVKNISGKKLSYVACNLYFYIFDTDHRIELIKQFCLCHSSITRIKQNSSIQHFPCGNEICLTTLNEILKLSKEIDTKQTLGSDIIPPKLIKIAYSCRCFL